MEIYKDKYQEVPPLFSTHHHGKDLSEQQNQESSLSTSSPEDMTSFLVNRK